jgi:hypothetical protein
MHLLINEDDLLAAFAIESALTDRGAASVVLKPFGAADLHRAVLAATMA